MEWVQLFLVATIISLLMWFLTYRPKTLPPGPSGLPLVGYLPFLGKYPYVTLMKLGKKYGGLYSVTLGNTRAIVLNDWQTIKESLYLQSEIFSGRPDTVMFHEVMGNKDVIGSYGPEWKVRRRFTLHQLRDLGFGKQSMEEVIMNEVNHLIQHFESLKDHKVVINDTFFMTFLNVIWTILSSNRFETMTDQLAEYVDVLKTIFREMHPLKKMNFFPFLQYVPGSGFQKYVNCHKYSMRFLEDEVEEHIRTYQEGHKRDFIDVFLSEIYKREKLKEKSESFQKDVLVYILQDLFNAAIDTGSSSLAWSLLYMAYWPEIQSKVQEELDSIVGRGRLPAYGDRSLLPYTTAVIEEMLRHVTIVPLPAAHATTRRTTLMGYTIPKGTFVIFNIWPVHRDPKFWGDPEIFRPERFLNSKGQFQKREQTIPFGIGGRVCPGESMARLELFLLFTSLLHQFKFSFDPAEKRPSLEPIVSLINYPQPYSLLVKRR